MPSAETTSGTQVLFACKPVTGTVGRHPTPEECRSTVTSSATGLSVEGSNARTVSVPRVGPLAVIGSIVPVTTSLRV